MSARYCRTCMRAYMRALRALSPDERQARRDAGLPLVDIDALWAQGVTS